MGKSQQQQPFLVALSSKTGVASICVLIIGLHLALAASGGLLAPAETSLAESARLLIDGQGTEGSQLDLLEPPLARWLSAAGLSLFGRSAFAARFLPVLLSSLLIVGCGLLCIRFGNPRQAAWVMLALLTTPLWLGHAGQTSAATLTTGSVALVAFSLAMLGKSRNERPLWLAPLLGAAWGLAFLAGGSTGVTISVLMVIGFLLFAPSAEAEGSKRAQLLAGGLIAVGAILIVACLRHGSTGWPSTPSIFRSFCPIEDGERSATMAWWGLVVAAVGLVVLRHRTARSLGLHVSVVVAALVGLPWYLFTWLSAETVALCATLPLPAAIERPGAAEFGVLVRRLGYGLYPWMAFLPIGLIKLTSRMREEITIGRVEKSAETAPPREDSAKDRSPEPMVLAISLWAAASITATLAGVSPLTPALVSSAVALAVLGGLGLSVVTSDTKGSPSERTAYAVGAFLLLVVLKDLLGEPTLLTSAALPAFSTVVPPVRGAILVGALSLLALVLMALGSLGLSSVLRTLTHRFEGWGRKLIWLSLLGCAFILIAKGVVPLSRNSSWAEVFGLYASEHEEGEPLFSYRELGSDAAFYINDQEMESLQDAADVRSALNGASGRVFFATRTVYYRQLSEMINRLTGERPRPVNVERQRHLLVVYEGPSPDEASVPAPVVGRIPRGLRRDPERMAGGAVELVGADMIAENARPGDTVGLITYYRCLRNISIDMSVTVILQEAEGDERYTFEHTPTHGRYPTSSWNVDEIVEDRMEVVVPPGAPSGRWEALVEMGRDSTRRSARRLIGRFDIED